MDLFHVKESARRWWHLIRYQGDPTGVRRRYFFMLLPIEKQQEFKSDSGVSLLEMIGSIEWTDPRPNNIPAPTPDKAVARCFDLQVGKCE